MTFDPGIISGVRGFMDDDEAKRLHLIAIEASKLGPCLEVGSYCGKSTICLGLACRQNGGVLFALDHHRGNEEQQPGQEYFDPETFDQRSGRIDTFGEFRANIEAAGLTDTVAPLVCPSAVAARQWATPLGLVFIDGGHSLEAAYRDYINWSRHLRPGGYLLFHDIFENPAEGGQAPYLVYQMAMASRQFEELERTKSLRVLRRLPCEATPPIGL
ncbi:conserved hypothetical protein [Desulfarculus baarsii DSM 2075]|uniref:Class I SAM-dependent methyltransferase n=1 Tax=Desulfarculus baarsii (strain ATCC 33931 / DSM 2075 / LMG 7858 / VKM B-1802 / 2st14) TaxID=644282 RepID=E1QIJ1_DESB2|nr:class I SAM-dependent methyltransferase [Desulfarculus baarsii]ADK84414.1 conserved hypothetical protein [Desulfarculus baarsii DSM 2075]